MRRLAIFAAILLFVSTSLQAGPEASAGYKGPKDKLHIYLLIGQSNMAGRAPFTADEAKPIDRCFLLNGSNEWEPATNPMNRYSTIRKGLDMQKMNPGYMFSQIMLKKDASISLGLVVNAKGGSKIEQWAKGTKFYNDAVERTKIAQKTGTLKGILWHQGESNQGNPDGYLDKLDELIENLRNDLGEKNLPFVAGQVNNVPAINEQIAQLPQKTKNTGFVSSDGLKCQDRWHFNAEAMKLLGQRYAEQMLKLLGGSSKPAKSKSSAFDKYRK